MADQFFIQLLPGEFFPAKMALGSRLFVNGTAEVQGVADGVAAGAAEEVFLGVLAVISKVAHDTLRYWV